MQNFIKQYNINYNTSLHDLLLAVFKANKQGETLRSFYKNDHLLRTELVKVNLEYHLKRSRKIELNLIPPLLIFLLK